MNLNGCTKIFGLLAPILLLFSAFANGQDDEHVVDISSLIGQELQSANSILNLEPVEESVVSNAYQQDHWNRIATKYDNEEYRQHVYAKETGQCDQSIELQPKACYYRGLGYSYQAYKVPKLAAPYQVQIVSTEAFVSAKDLKTKFPGRELWELRHVCGATLISNRWVLTAAHCLTDNPKPEHFALRLDVGNISQPESKPVPIKRIIPHPDFRRKDLKNDIALIEFDPGSRQIFEVKDESASDTLSQFFHKEKSNRFVTLTANNLLQVFDAKRGRNLRFERLDNSDRETRYKLDEKGEYLIKTHETGFEIIDVNSGKTSLRVNGIVMSSHSLKLVSNTREVILSKYDGRISIYNLRGAQRPNIVEAGQAVDDVHKISKDRLIVIGEGRYAYWDTKTKRKISFGKIDNLMGDPILNKRERRVTLHGVNSSVVLNLDTGKEVLRVPNDSPLRSLGALIKGDTKLVTLEYPKKANVFDLITGRPAGSLDLDITPFKSLIFDRDRHLLVWSNEGEFEIWDIARKRKLRSFKVGVSTLGAIVKLFGRHNKVFVGDQVGRSQIWDLKKGVLVADFEHSVSVENFSMTDDEKYVLAISKLGTVEILDLERNVSKARFFHSRDLSGAQLINRGKSLMSWGNRGRIKIWDIKSNKEKARLLATTPGGGLSSRDNKPVLIKTLSIGKLPNIFNEDTFVQTFGWGKTKPIRGRAPSAVLGLISLQVLSREECLNQTGWKQKVIHDGVFCANDNRRKTCFGDSGGPVVMSDDYNGDRLVGIVSWGSNKCGEGEIPSVYTNVNKYDRWIDEHVCSTDGLTGREPAGICNNPAASMSMEPEFE